MFQVSASDPDCGVNAMVNYTLGEGFKKLSEFEVKDVTGEVCIVGDLDYEKRSSYEFPIIATDRGKDCFYFYACVRTTYMHILKYTFMSAVGKSVSYIYGGIYFWQSMRMACTTCNYTTAAYTLIYRMLYTFSLNSSLYSEEMSGNNLFYFFNI